ncbi:hypothetical protein V3A08_02510 [Tenacibaculum maritimum]|uniref:hypothetical protein n=2 Tax=Tenacibaculum maritimum TaxID=107401 RepID=UPI001330A2C4|nr:hypothetical protein [Tenacibaculum maritimum]
MKFFFIQHSILGKSNTNLMLRLITSIIKTEINHTYLSITHKEVTSFPEAGLTIWFFYLGIQTKRFDNFSNFFLSENYLKTSFK